MRLWSLHPRYLDSKGLVALWREALLARAVLRGETRGYQHHPQLERFRAHPSPRLAINAYLAAVQREASVRGYRFDRSKIGPCREVPPIAVTAGQVEFEWEHLMHKLAMRSPALFAQWRLVGEPECHPLFQVGPGAVADWEKRKEAHTRQPPFY
ncbi:MAG TPA: pyrimidine dimer DNA glycosylase/endonuclease V [Hyphomicrobiales bacterium]|nr:pyrimidine dimer DNA glycosylase/endonuclease V [Hyphomicrobiales bacterium]